MKLTKSRNFRFRIIEMMQLVIAMISFLSVIMFFDIGNIQVRKQSFLFLFLVLISWFIVISIGIVIIDRLEDIKKLQ